MGIKKVPLSLPHCTCPGGFPPSLLLNCRPLSSSHTPYSLHEQQAYRTTIQITQPNILFDRVVTLS